MRISTRPPQTIELLQRSTDVNLLLAAGDSQRIERLEKSVKVGSRTRTRTKRPTPVLGAPRLN